MLFVLTLALAGPATPQTQSPLRWEAPDTCPDATWVIERFSELVPQGPAESFEARGKVEQKQGEFSLVWVVHTAAGENEQHRSDTDCKALATAYALSVALQVEPIIAREATERASEQSEAATRDPTARAASSASPRTPSPSACAASPSSPSGSRACRRC